MKDVKISFRASIDGKTSIPIDLQAQKEMMSSIMRSVKRKNKELSERLSKL